MPLDNTTDARAWADRHDAWSATVSRTVGEVRNAFEALARIQYAAPWKARVQTSAAGSACASRSAQPPGSAASKS